MPEVPSEQIRLVTKVARLYHSHGVRQVDIAQRLHISQSRVSRLLQAAEDQGIVRTVVAFPEGVHGELEEEIERRYGLAEVHVVDVAADEEPGLLRDLGEAMADVVASSLTGVRTIGYTSWSRSLREMVASLPPVRADVDQVVELIGDLGPPAVQHEAARSTQRLAQLTGATATFLRVPGVVQDARLRSALLDQDPYARSVLASLDSIDLALVGVGTCHIVAPLTAGDNFFTEEQLALARGLGAVGEVNLRFIDAQGERILTPLDDLVVGVSAEQLRGARRRLAVAGGSSKHAAILATVRGGWIDGLVTDMWTAEALLAAHD
ncbi:MAG: sugar-binding domain-containing protein [Nocardioidaceae bacterium]|nr:sugar-binding domain-containing protein [Nocardioidaceae bacterium]